MKEPARRPRLLVVDDEAHQRDMLGRILERAGYDAVTAGGADEALGLLGRERFDLLLTDQRMPRGDGMELLRRARERDGSLPVVLMTAYGSVSSAVEAMRHGAADYLTKPFEKDELLLVLERVLRQRRLEAEVAELHGVLQDRYRLHRIIGRSPEMQRVFSLIERVARTDVPVLVRGESGTGKELVARALHAESGRAQGPFVALNCAAVPEGLLESEFFGHEKGAFTGALRSHAGRFEQAHGGTLFLDEVGAMRIDLQAKLLRAIQERQVQRVGGSATIDVDVRLVAATGENLEQAIRARTFREDLYWRLNVVPVHLPPLRDRHEDVVLLVDHFLATSARKLGRPVPGVAPDVMARLLAHPWPGNVRELENVLERMVVLARGPRLELPDLPAEIRDGSPDGGMPGFELPPGGVRLPDLERHLISQALRRSRGVIGPAARLLGISYKTLQYRIRKHGLDREAAAGELASVPPGEADEEPDDPLPQSR